ncbi:aminoacyl-tRNA hydrolase [Candidatus Saccharibacteria bacterium]|nr:aminoacyl-tRNA hydrolase [Candidatus Saccharibacteria bacterium]
MGLFVRKNTAISSDGPAFVIGSQQTILIVGLGNIGKEYTNTRHNIGFHCVDAFVMQQDFPKWSTKSDLHCDISRSTIGNMSIVLIKPDTYMNESGQAVQAAKQYFKIPNSQILVIHDELDLEFGTIRTQNGGGAAGHNGIKSIIQHCGDDFARIRIGIKNERAAKMDSADFVLAKFTGDEMHQLPALTREVLNLVTEYTATGAVSSQTLSFLA